MFLELKQRIYVVFVSRSFNINRVATQAVEDVLNIGEYRNSYYNYHYKMLQSVYVYDIIYYMIWDILIKIFSPFFQ